MLAVPPPPPPPAATFALASSSSSTAITSLPAEVSDGLGPKTTNQSFLYNSFTPPSLSRDMLNEMKMNEINEKTICL